MPSSQHSLQGKLILDSGKLQGSFFDQSVILLCRHDENGAFGLVLNRFSGHKLGDAIGESLSSYLEELPLLLGGPVQGELLSFLIHTPPQPNPEVLPWLNMGHSLLELKKHAEDLDNPQDARVFAGYSGWSAGQLEQEIKNNCWLIHPATEALVFQAKPEELWRGILQQMGGIHSIMARSPDHPHLN
ncbi:MAG: YqgE/AlgH family protein [Verrucomicrobiae bacterium]|nr:YqgE/AlgH family protein [Verrucomicrobiae bacterium]